MEEGGTSPLVVLLKKDAIRPRGTELFQAKGQQTSSLLLPRGWAFSEFLCSTTNWVAGCTLIFPCVPNAKLNNDIPLVRAQLAHVACTSPHSLKLRESLGERGL